jgi:hypothetical protein
MGREKNMSSFGAIIAPTKEIKIGDNLLANLGSQYIYQ